MRFFSKKTNNNSHASPSSNKQSAAKTQRSFSLFKKKSHSADQSHIHEYRNNTTLSSQHEHNHARLPSLHSNSKQSNIKSPKGSLFRGLVQHISSFPKKSKIPPNTNQSNINKQKPSLFKALSKQIHPAKHHEVRQNKNTQRWENDGEGDEYHDDDDPGSNPMPKRCGCFSCCSFVSIAITVGTMLMGGGMAIWQLLEKTPMPSMPCAILILAGFAFYLAVCAYYCCCRDSQNADDAFDSV